MTGFLFSLAAFIGALIVLIAVHEFGHFWVARRLGVKILRFSIGFGKPVYSRLFGSDQTEFAIGAIPLGGYVKMLDENEADVPAADRPRAFNRQSLATRTAIVAAGPVFNLLFAVVAFWLMYMTGVPGMRPVVGEVVADSIAARAGITADSEFISVDDAETPVWDSVLMGLLEGALRRNEVSATLLDTEGREIPVMIDLSGDEGLLEDDDLMENIGIRPWRPRLRPVLDRVVAGDPAERAGLQSGDEIISANAQPVDDWERWVAYVRSHPDVPIRVSFRRDGRELQTILTPAPVESEAGVTGRIGAYVRVPEDLGDDMRRELRYLPLPAFSRAVEKTGAWIKVTAETIWGMMTGSASVRNISGPVTIAKYAGDSADIGLAYFLRFLGVISISLGILNLLPIPVLDGGHLMYYAVEFVTGSPVSDRVRELGQQAGIFMLLMLMGLAFYNDFLRLFG